MAVAKKKRKTSRKTTKRQVKQTTTKVLTKAQRLTRERAIIRDLRAGKLSYRQIAAQHSVSLPTVNAKARKAGIRRRPGVRPAGATKAARPAGVARRSLTAMPRRGTATREQFAEQFRSLVMRYYPNMSLARFEQLAQVIHRAIR